MPRSERRADDLYGSIRKFIKHHEYRPKDGGYRCECGWRGASISEHLAQILTEQIADMSVMRKWASPPMSYIVQHARATGVVVLKKFGFTANTDQEVTIATGELKAMLAEASVDGYKNAWSDALAQLGRDSH